MKLFCHIPFIILLAFSSSGFSEPDTLYHWDFPDPSWTPQGDNWTEYSDHIEVNLEVVGDGFLPDVKVDALLHDPVEIPSGTDTLQVILNYQSIHDLIASYGGDALASSYTQLLDEEDVIWQDSFMVNSSDSFSCSGPVSLNITGFGNWFTPSLKGRVWALMYYGYAEAYLHWEVASLTLIGKGATSLDRDTWAGIKSCF